MDYAWPFITYLDANPHLKQYTTYAAISLTTATVLLVTAVFTMGLFSKNHMPIAGRNFILTGASQGMGLAVALNLANQGANIAIIARDKSKLALAATQIQAAMDASPYSNQKVTTVSADLTNPTAAAQAIDEAEAVIGPTAVLWCMAGGATPKLFIDFTTEELVGQMNTNYWSALYITHAMVKKMITRAPDPDLKTKVAAQRKIVFTSSLLALAPVAGYSSYAGPKAGLRALADSLRNELILYDIGVHCCFPGGILTPGFDTENMTKPEITRKIEETDVPETAEWVAEACIKGLQAGETLPVTSVLTMAARASMWGPTPHNWWLMEWMLTMISAVVWIFVRRGHDAIVWTERRKVGFPWDKKN